MPLLFLLLCLSFLSARLFIDHGPGLGLYSALLATGGVWALYSIRKMGNQDE